MCASSTRRETIERFPQRFGPLSASYQTRGRSSSPLKRYLSPLDSNDEKMPLDPTGEEGLDSDDSEIDTRTAPSKRWSYYHALIIIFQNQSPTPRRWQKQYQIKYFWSTVSVTPDATETIPENCQENQSPEWFCVELGENKTGENVVRQPGYFPCLIICLNMSRRLSQNGKTLQLRSIKTH